MGVPEVPFRVQGRTHLTHLNRTWGSSIRFLKLDGTHRAHSSSGTAPLFISSSKQRKSSLYQPPRGVDGVELTEGFLHPPLSSRAEPTAAGPRKLRSCRHGLQARAPERVLSAAQVPLVSGCSQKPALNAQERVVGLVCSRALTFQRSQHHSSEPKTAES